MLQQQQQIHTDPESTAITLTVSADVHIPEIDGPLEENPALQLHDTQPIHFQPAQHGSCWTFPAWELQTPSLPAQPLYAANTGRSGKLLPSEAYLSFMLEQLQGIGEVFEHKPRQLDGSVPGCYLAPYYLLPSEGVETGGQDGHTFPL